MTLHRAAGVALVLAAAGTVCAGTAAWQRRLEFAKQLSTPPRPYEDLSQAVIAEILADPAIKGEEQALLYREMGKYYVELTERVTGREALTRVTEYLGKARDFFGKYVAHPAIKDQPKHAGEIFDTRLRGIWIAIHLARVHVKIADDPDAAKPEQVKHKAAAVDLYKGVIKDFEALVEVKKQDEAKVKARAPQEKAARQQWEGTYSAAQQEHVRVRVYLNDTRVELGKLLKRTGSQPQEWRPLIEAACKDYKDILLAYAGKLSILQVNVNYSEALVELGPEQDQEALDRLSEVWEARQTFAEKNKAVPCKAAHVKASIQFRQKKYKEALDTLDEMLKARTGGAWDPEVISADKVTKTLQELEDGNVAEQYDTRATGGSFLLEAEIYAAVAKQAEDAKKPSREVERDYAIAYQIAVGVWDAKVPMDAKYFEKIELWRKKGRQRVSPAAILAEIAKALKEAEKDKPKYIEAAKLYTELLSFTSPDPEQMRKTWDTIARCYYGGGAYYEAYMVFTTLSRWFPDPETQAFAYAQMAVSAINTQYDASVKAKAGEDQIKFEKKLLDEARVHGEELSPEGPSFRYIIRAREERKAGRHDKALEILREVTHDSPAYAHALYETGLTQRELFETAIKADPKSQAAAKNLKDALDSFQKCLDHCKKKLPELKGEEKAAERDRLIEAAATNLAIYSETLLLDHVKQATKVLELTAGVKEAFPGIEKAFTYPLIIYNRMHAAYTTCTDARGTVESAGKALPIIDECWKILREFTGFRRMVNACKRGASAYDAIAQKLESQAKKTADAAAKAGLDKQAAAARDRGLEFYIELLNIAPRQPLATYRYVVNQLDKRVRQPKSADYRQIVEIGAKALDLFGKEEASHESNQFKIMVAVAHCRLEAWRDAIALLEEVDGHYEPAFQTRMKDYEKRKQLAEERPDKYPDKPKMPQRHPYQLQAREWLARCYLEAKASSKYEDAIAIYVDQVRLYPRDTAKYWEGMSLLIEAYRLNKNYDEAVGQLYRLAEAIEQDPVKAPARGSKADLAEVAARLRKNVEASGTAAQKGALLPLMDKILKLLGK